MKIAIRLDDITEDMDWKKFLSFKKLLDQHNIKPLIGVVPMNQDKMLSIDPPKANFWEYIKELQREDWVIAMHGCHHVYDTKNGGNFPLNDFSELAGNRRDVQKQKIERGKMMLEGQGISTDFFMAPGHSYDDITLEVLKEAGFKRITDGFGKYPYEYKGLTFYPISFRMKDSLKDSEGYTTMVVHTNTIDDMEYYEKMFKEHADKFISYAEYLNITARKRGKLEQKKEYFLARLKHHMVRIASKNQEKLAQANNKKAT